MKSPFSLNRVLRDSYTLLFFVGPSVRHTLPSLLLSHMIKKNLKYNPARDWGIVMYPALFNFFLFLSFLSSFLSHVEYSHGLTGPYSCPYANGYRWNNRIFFLITSLFLLALPVCFFWSKRSSVQLDR